jgi:RNA polymerase sigma-70 factor (ECF subfamily)
VGAGNHVEQEYRLLYERHWRRVRAYALRRSSNASAADDVVADVFLTAWRRFGDVPSDNELAWLLGVARRVLSNTHRGDARRERLLARLHEAHQTSPTEQDGIEAASDDERVDRVRAALTRLRDSDAEILQLASWEQLSHAQIAVVLDCSINAVAIRLHRARQRLAEELAKESDNSGHTEPNPMPRPLTDRQP